MYYYNDFQDDMYYDNEFRQSEIPYYCPYCQYSIEEAQFQNMHRSPQDSPPSAAPPPYTPSLQQAQVKSVPGVGAVDPGSLRPCRYKYVYIWPKRGRGYWAWLTYVGSKSTSGYKWNGHRWVYFGVDLRSIDSFTCL